MRKADQKIVLVTRSTQLDELERKFNTRSQARFQMVSAKKRVLAQMHNLKEADLDVVAGAAFEEVDAASGQYDAAVSQIRADLDFQDLDIPLQVIDRSFLPNYLFGPNDVVVTVGQDGLVANTAKYAMRLPIVAVNPDPDRIDGILLPFRVGEARQAVQSVLQGRAAYREVTLAEARFEDGQRLLAFNELFIGSRTHVSARYRLEIGGKRETQSSSGVLVSTGAGSTGWLSSVFNMASGVAAMFGGPQKPQAVRLKWEDPRLVYVVREPFTSKSSAASMVAGMLSAGGEITIESEMASNGVIFSDGVESDFLPFNAGTTARIRTADAKARLVVRP